ncbi:hypothetical protein KR059_000479, partial [Drosophila kikkawai]
SQPEVSCFHRGSYIELSSGSLRRVEDIRTEDFIQSALRSQIFDLREATVVRIDRGGQGVTITFSYDTQHDKVVMEVLPGHPLFVYGQGWASCNPQLSLQLYELKCQQLQVGDICLSLVQREELAPPPPLPVPLPVPPCPRAEPPRQPVQYNPPAGALPPPFEHPYQVYAQMANFVAAYTQHMMNKLQD